MVIRRWPGRPGRARHSTPMISLDRLVCRAYGAQALTRRSVKIHCSQPACRQHQRPRCSLRIIGMLWTGRSCRRRQCWLWRKRKRATGPASAPKLRQNRFKYSATPEIQGEISPRIKCSSLRFKCNTLLYLNRGLPGSAVYDLSTVRHLDRCVSSIMRCQNSTCADRRLPCPTENGQPSAKRRRGSK